MYSIKSPQKKVVSSRRSVSRTVTCSASGTGRRSSRPPRGVLKQEGDNRFTYIAKDGPGSGYRGFEDDSPAGKPPTTGTPRSSDWSASSPTRASRSDYSSNNGSEPSGHRAPRPGVKKVHNGASASYSRNGNSHGSNSATYTPSRPYVRPKKPQRGESPDGRDDDRYGSSPRRSSSPARASQSSQYGSGSYGSSERRSRSSSPHVHREKPTRPQGSDGQASDLPAHKLHSRSSRSLSAPGSQRRSSSASRATTSSNYGSNYGSRQVLGFHCFPYVL